MSEIKEEVRQAVKDQMLQEQVQAKIMQNVVVTPKEVKDFFNDIPNDSLPLIQPEYEIVQIVKRPPVSIDEKLQVKDRLYQIRKRILEGESSFSTMAVLYSEDPGSARQGGELGFAGKGVYATEFENNREQSGLRSGDGCNQPLSQRSWCTSEESEVSRPT
jgi:peptidyl-prolyl cis-trans isomerase SurA